MSPGHDEVFPGSEGLVRVTFSESINANSLRNAVKISGRSIIRNEMRLLKGAIGFEVRVKNLPDGIHKLEIESGVKIPWRCSDALEVCFAFRKGGRR